MLVSVCFLNLFKYFVILLCVFICTRCVRNKDNNNYGVWVSSMCFLEAVLSYLITCNIVIYYTR